MSGAGGLLSTSEELGEELVLFDAGSRTRPPGLNPLEGTDKARAVDNLVSIFARIHAAPPRRSERSRPVFARCCPQLTESLCQSGELGGGWVCGRVRPGQSNR